MIPARDVTFTLTLSRIIITIMLLMQTRYDL